MIKSMTGFAHREMATPLMRASLAIKSYNNRYLDISVSLPSQLARLEPRFRDFLSSRIVHGKVECYFKLRELNLPVIVRADLAAARKVASVLADIGMECGIDQPVRLSDLLTFDGIIAYDRDVDEDALWDSVLPELEACFSDYDDSRVREGKSTLDDINCQLGRIRASFGTVLANVAEIDRTIRAQLSSRFKEVMGSGADESRILAETAILLVKFSVNEEVNRLSAHLASFERIIGAENAPGKKLDFLCQEINREVNTIGSKNMLLPVAESVIEIKDALENIREQLRNIE